MSLGLGVFLAALILSAVILFAATKDRWNWRKIIVRTAALATVNGAALAAASWWSNRPKAETELWGIALGDSTSDVKFKKGSPESLVFGQIWAYPYDQIGTYAYVEFYNDKVDRIFIFLGDYQSIASLRGVGFKNSLKDVRGVFGEPSFVEDSADSSWRLVSFSNFNSSFLLTKDMVFGLSIFNGQRNSRVRIGDKLIQASYERRRLKEERVAEEEAIRAHNRKLAEAREQAKRAKEKEEKEAKRTAWANLQIGMEQHEVEELLGRPRKITNFGSLGITWYYPPIDSGFVELTVLFSSSGEVKAFDGPRL